MKELRDLPTYGLLEGCFEWLWSEEETVLWCVEDTDLWCVGLFFSVCAATTETECVHVCACACVG